MPSPDELKNWLGLFIRNPNSAPDKTDRHILYHCQPASQFALLFKSESTFWLALRKLKAPFYLTLNGRRFSQPIRLLETPEIRARALSIMRSRKYQLSPGQQTTPTNESEARAVIFASAYAWLLREHPNLGSNIYICPAQFMGRLPDLTRKRPRMDPRAARTHLLLMSVISGSRKATRQNIQAACDQLLADQQREYDFSAMLYETMRRAGFDPFDRRAVSKLNYQLSTIGLDLDTRTLRRTIRNAWKGNQFQKQEH